MSTENEYTPTTAQPHTPTDDERESLARAQLDAPMSLITWDELTEKASRGEGDYREGDPQSCHVVRRRKAGPWLPVTTNETKETK